MKETLTSKLRESYNRTALRGAKCKKRCAMRPPKSARGGKRKLAAILMAFLLIGMTSCGDYPHANEVHAVYRYTVQLYFMDGGTAEKTFLAREEKYEPHIGTGYRGGFPRFHWISDKGRSHSMDGVCRFKVISKRDVSEEYYGKKIISTRQYWDAWTYTGGTLHTLEQKGGRR